MFLLQSLESCPFDDGVLEETARTANLLHIGKLGIADGTNGVVELLQGWAFNAVLLQIGFDVTILEVERCIFLQ